MSVKALCHHLGYSRQAYYKSLRNSQLKRCCREKARQKVLVIRKQMPRLGGNKLYYLLSPIFTKENMRIGRDKLFTLLRESNLLVIRKKRYTQTTNSKHWMYKHPNLIKDVKPQRPEQIWVADITYLSTKQGFSYLHLLTDAYSKKIMGYELCNDMAATSTLKALKMALQQRQYDGPVIHHSDRGSQYCSAIYVKQLQEAGIKISMTQDGSPYDNAIAERVNGILKDEFGLDDIFKDFEQLRLQTSEAISLYNANRPHMSCSMLTPEAMHSQQELEVKAWHKKSASIVKDPCTFLPSLLYH